jgi:CheY-like chemotaxis protein
MAGELILIVEDNDKNRKLVRDVLTFKGYAIIEAETGEAGIRLALERRPSLVLMDTAPRHRRDGSAQAAPRRADHSGDSRHGHDRVGDE